MKPVQGNISTDFFEMRPLSKPPEKRDHNHGAIDIAAPVATPIRAPEDGTAFAWCAYRTTPGTYWPDMPTVNGLLHHWCNYFYDTFGGVIVLQSKDFQRTHIITHSYGNQLFNKGLYRGANYVEQKDDCRFPIHGVYTEIKTVGHGETIGYVGNAGYSTGPHIHWEIHRGMRWNRWENRINPERWE